MEEGAMLLTPKALYRLLTGNLPLVVSPVMLRKERGGCETLSRFWWNALMGFAPGAILDPYFNVELRGRSRSLSNIMNRSRSPAMPVKLEQALMEGLDSDRFRGLCLWLLDKLDPQQDLAASHRAVTRLEELCEEGDAVFSALMPFFKAIRGNDRTDGPRRSLFLLAVRLSWLGLHAIFGAHMRPALKELRADRACGTEALWRAYLLIEGIVEQAPELPEASTVTLTFEPRDLPEGAPDAAAKELAAILIAPPPVPPDAAYLSRFAGWYVVANWTDPHVALNDTPRPTYSGAQLQTTVPNGTPIYIVMASDYRGLNRSAGNWGPDEMERHLGLCPHDIYDEAQGGQGRPGGG